MWARPTLFSEHGDSGILPTGVHLKVDRRKKGGKEHRYFSIVESRRVSRRRVVHRTVVNLGEINDRLVAPDNDPERAPKLARIRLIGETLRPREVLLSADELDLHLLPKSGY